MLIGMFDLLSQFVRSFIDRDWKLRLMDSIVMATVDSSRGSRKLHKDFASKE